MKSDVALARMGSETVRIGTDLCSVDAIEAAVERFGDRYLSRVYTDAEIDYCTSGASWAQHLAARFAAKEATIKVLRPAGWWLDWRSIEVHREPEGWCELRLSGEAESMAASAGIVSLAVSLSHEGQLATAVVVAGLRVRGTHRREGVAATT